MDRLSKQTDNDSKSPETDGGSVIKIKEIVGHGLQTFLRVGKSSGTTVDFVLMDTNVLIHSNCSLWVCFKHVAKKKQLIII